MNFNRATLETCHTATGTVVVIDVLRAFTTAAYAFAAGATDIALVSTVDEALTLRRKTPGALIMGEVKGLPVEGFDFNNSPSALQGLDLSGRRMIQRTSAGTQGMVRSRQAELLLAGSLVCAAATVRYLKQLETPGVTFVITGRIYDREGDEDAACADYLTALLQGQAPQPDPIVQRVYDSTAGRKFADPDQPELPLADLQAAVQIDQFDFAMQVQRQAGLLLLEKVTATP